MRVGATRPRQTSQGDDKEKNNIGKEINGESTNDDDNYDDDNQGEQSNG